jgi:hypothetical protein
MAFVCVVVCNTGEGSREEYAAFAARLNTMMAKQRMTGKGLRQVGGPLGEKEGRTMTWLAPLLRPAHLPLPLFPQLVFDKWGKTYDVRITRLHGRFYLQV